MNIFENSKETQKIEFIITVILMIGMTIYSFSRLPMSEKSAKKLLNEKFELCMELIHLSESHFKFSKETTLIKEDYCYEIINYNSVCNKYLTENAKTYFNEHAICAIFDGDKTYVTEGGSGFSGFGGVEFENLYITVDSITADAVQTRVDADGDFKEKIKSTFCLVKSADDEWKIDEFSYVEDLNSWVEYE